MTGILSDQPVLVGGLVSAISWLALALGLQLSDAQKGAIGGAVALLVSLVARRAVTPNKRVPPRPVAPPAAPPPPAA